MTISIRTTGYYDCDGREVAGIDTLALATHGLNHPFQACNIWHKPTHRVELIGLVSEHDLQERAEIGFAQVSFSPCLP